MPLNMSFDDAKKALLNLTPEEQEKVYSEYPYLRMEKAQINQSLSNLAPEEQEEVFAELPEFRPKPAGGILDALTAAPSLAYQGTKEGLLGALSAVGENMPYPTENFMPVQPELQTQYQKSLEQIPYTPENIREVKIPEAQTAIQNIYQEKNLQPGTVGGVAADVFTSMGQMAPIVGMSLVAPELAPAGLALLSTVSGGQKYNEARKAGYNEKEALLQGLGYGAAEFIGEKIGLDALVDGFKNVAKRPALVNIVREVLKNAGVEASEESATQVIQNAIDIGAQKYNPTPQVKVPGLFEGVPYAALTGGLTGGLMGGGTSALGSLLESPTATEPAPQNMEQTTANLTQPEVNVEDAAVVKAAEEEIKAEQAAQERQEGPQVITEGINTQLEEEPPVKTSEIKETNLNQTQGLPVDEINQAPELQFKRNVDKNLVTDKLKGRKYNELLAGAIDVFVNPEDGKTYVWNGNHRLVNAKENNIPAVKTIFSNFANMEEARTAAILKNLAENNGEPLDYRNFFKEANETDFNALKTTMADKGIDISKGMAVKGYALSKLNDYLTNEYERGTLPENIAIEIGKAQLSEPDQNALYKHIKNKYLENKTTPATSQVRNLIEFARSTPKQEGEADLFGDTEVINQMSVKSEIADYIGNVIKKDKNILKKLSSEDLAGAATERELGKIKTEQAAVEAQKAALAEMYFKKRMFAKGDEISNVLNEATQRVIDGEVINKVKADTFIKTRKILESEATNGTKKIIAKSAIAEPSVERGESKSAERNAPTESVVENKPKQSKAKVKIADIKTIEELAANQTKLSDAKVTSLQGNKATVNLKGKEYNVIETPNGLKYEEYIALQPKPKQDGLFEEDLSDKEKDQKAGEKTEDMFGGDYLVAPMPSNQQQEAINTLAGFDQTDLIMMVEALDAIPEVKKRLRNEQALGQFVKKDNGRIVLPMKMGQADKNMVAKVLAHELGHLIDWSTGAVKNKMPKGNIFAHIGAMAKYFKKTLNLEPGATPENLTAKERAKIRYKAKKETIQSDGTYNKIALKNRYRELIAEYIKDNNLIERETVVMELLDLTQKWWGITDEMMADEKYLSYLSKPSELYANAFSAFLTEPATFEALAPQTSQMIYDYMTEERPQFYQIYKMFQDAMQKGESLQNKITWLRDRIKLASEKRLAYKLTKAPETSTGTLFKKQYIDSMSALLDLAKVPGQKIDYDFINKIELYRNNRDVMEGYLLEFMPEINDELKKQGLSIDGIGIDAFLKRIIGERGLKFLDVVSKDMAEQMNAAIKADYTPEQMKAINNTFVNLWKQRKKSILEPLRDNEFLPKEIIDYMLKTEDYQTWDIGEQYENLYSKSSPATGSVIKKQMGTFKAVANPLVSTILKDLSLLRFLGKQMATKAVIDKLKEHGVAVPEAKKKYNGAFWQFVEPDSKSGQELVMLSSKDGIKGYYVDKGIAEALENKPLEINSIIKMMLLPNKIIRGSFTGWNPAFLVLLNPIRDVQGSFLKMPYVLQNFGEWSKDMAVELYKAVTNTQNKKQIAEQTKAGNLIGEHESVLDPDLIKTEEQSIEAMYKGQQHDYKKYGVAVDKLMGLFDMFQALGKRLERFPKLAADKFYQAIKSKYNLSDAEINYFIRNFAGSPDFRRKGTQYANYNNLFLYSNAAKEGYRAHIDSAKYSPTEYFVKMAGASIGYMAALMLLESAFKDWWDKVPEYYKTNYYVIPSPFGHYDENGKPVFWTFPKDEASRFIGSAFRKIFKFNPEAWLESLTQIAAVGADELPMTSPIFKALGILSQAGTGVIPTDSRTGRPLISQRDWDIRTKEPMTTITALAKAISNQTGGGAWWKFDTTKKDNVATPSDIEKLSKMPMFGLNVLGRFLRVGDTENKFAKYEESKDRKGDIAYELTQIDRLVVEKLKPAFEKYNSVPKAIATLTREEKKLLSLHEVYFKDKMLEVSNPQLFKRKQDLLEQRRNKKFELNRNK